MSQIMYNYPAMLGHAADMSGYAGMLHSVGSDIATQQAALSSGWSGTTGLTYQRWQTQWNESLEALISSYRAMASNHESNTMSMSARDMAEAAKWGG